MKMLWHCLLIHTQRFQLLHALLPHRLNVDAAEAPIRCYLDQVGALKAVRHNVVNVLIKVKHVFAVSKVSAILGVEGEMEEGLVKIEMVMKGVVAMVPVCLSVIRLSITVIVRPLLLTGKDLVRQHTFKKSTPKRSMVIKYTMSEEATVYSTSQASSYFVKVDA